MNIKRLGHRDFEEVMGLFLLCFLDDHFYCDLFPDSEDRAEKLFELCKRPVMHCLANGLCYGVQTNFRTVAAILCFDYDPLNRELNDMIFGSGSIVPRYVKQFDNICYELSIFTHPDYRGNGYAGALLDKILEGRKNDTMVSDVSNSSSLPLYESRGYTLDELCPGYTMVVRKGVS